MCKSIKYIYWVKKDLFGLVWKVWLYRRHSKRNQLKKITMTITTVLHSRAAPSLEYLPVKQATCNEFLPCLFFFIKSLFRIVPFNSKCSSRWCLLLVITYVVKSIGMVGGNDVGSVELGFLGILFIVVVVSWKIHFVNSNLCFAFVPYVFAMVSK